MIYYGCLQPGECGSIMYMYVRCKWHTLKCTVIEQPILRLSLPCMQTEPQNEATCGCRELAPKITFGNIRTYMNISVYVLFMLSC